MDNVFDGLPTIHAVLTDGAQVNPALLGRDVPPPPPVDPNAGKGFLGAALGSGARSLASEVASGVGAASRFAGATGLAQSADDFAAQQKAAAAASDNTNYSSLPWYSPTGLAYRTLQGLPTMGAAALGAAAAVPLAVGAGVMAPEVAGVSTAGAIARALGGAAALYPSSVGQGVQRAQDEGQPVDDGKALALGAPQALLQGALAAYGEGALTKGIGGLAGKSTLAKVGAGAAGGAVAQAGVGAAGEALMQQMGDPNRSFASRAQDVLNAALMGAGQGAVFGGVIHGLAKTPPPEVTNDDLNHAVNTQLQLTGPADQRSTITQPQLPAPGTPGTEARIPDTQHFSVVPEPPAPGPEGPITTPVQPGQTTPLLEPPGSAPLGSAEPIVGRQLHVGEDVEPPQTPLLPAPEPQAAREERVPRPASDDEPLVTPPVSGDPSTMSGADLIAAAGKLTGNEVMSHPIMQEIRDRVKGLPLKSADDIRQALLDQDTAKAKEAVATTNAATIKAQVDGNANRLPAFLKDPAMLGDTQALKSEIYDRITKAKVPPTPKTALFKAAKAFGVLDQDENLIDPRQQVEQDQTPPPVSPTAIPEGEPQANPVPSQATRPTLPDGHPQMGIWKALETQRSNLPDSRRAEIEPVIDAAQAKLALMKRGDRSSAIGVLNGVKDVIKGAKASDKLTGVESPKTPTVIDDQAGAKKFDVPPPETQTAAPLDKVAEAAPAPTAAQTPPAEPKPPTKALEGLGAAMKPLRKVIQQLGNQKVEPNPPKTIKGVSTPESEKSIAARQKAYLKAVDALADQHDELLAAAKSGDMAKLRQVQDGFFGTGLHDANVEGKFGPSDKISALIDEANKHTSNILDAVKEATGQKGLDPRVAEPFASRVPNDRDVSLTQKIADGASVRDLLEDTVKNGSSSMRKSVAARLLQKKIDPSIRFGTQDEAQSEHPTLRNVYGDYSRDFDRVRVYDQADMEHTVLHEAVHAATIKGLQEPSFRAKVQGVMDDVKKLMTPDEQAHPAMKNPEEFIAESMTNPDFQRTLDGLRPDGSKMTLWDKFKNVVTSFLGLPKGAESMLDHVMHLGGEAMDLTDKARSDYAMSAPGLQETTGLYARTAQDNAERLKRALDTPAGLRALGTKAFVKALQWRLLPDIALSVREYIPSFPKLISAIRNSSNTETRINAPGLQTSLEWQAKSKKIKDQYNRLMAYTTEGIDYRRSAEQHTWLKNDPTFNNQKRADIADANRIYNNLKRTGDHTTLDNIWNVNRMHRHWEIAGTLDQLFKMPEFKDQIKLADDPMKRYREDTTGMARDPRRAADFAEATADRYLNIARKYVGNIEEAMKRETTPQQYAEMKAAGAKPEDLKAARASAERWESLNERREIMSSAERDNRTKQVQLSQAPNFGTGRTGGFFAAGKFKTGFKPSDVKLFQDELVKAGFGDAVMQPNNDQTRIYIRTKTQQQAENLKAVFDRMQQKGVLDKATPISHGSTDVITRTPGITPSWMNALIKNIDRQFPEVGEDVDPVMRDAIKTYHERQRAALTQQYLDMIPESHMSKLYAKRDDVHGFDANMLASNDHRLLNSARNLAGLYHRDEIAQAHAGMRADLRSLNQSTDPNHTTAVRARAAAAVNEAVLRQAQAAIQMPRNMFDGMRSLTHIMEMGFSPIYTANLAAQVYTMGVPKLAETHGYAKAIALMTKNMPKALKIIVATYSGLDKNHFIMSPEKLKGFSPQDREDLLRLDNMGIFATSAETTAMYESVHHHNPIMRALHDYSGAMTLNSEMIPRLVTALSALQAYRDKPVPSTLDYHDAHSFAANRVLTSQFDWNPVFNPRATSKHGFLGPVSPLVSQLQGYHIRLMEMMSRNIADLAGKRGPEQRKAAARFMLGHFAAMAAMAGTMGLPGVNMGAGVYDRLADWATGDNTHDIRASYRQYLADTFGNDMGEALAHGVPRFAGLNMSKSGEDRIIPFTDLVASKQKWEDATADWGKQLMGPAYSIASNWVLAARDLHNGDLLEAATRLGPEVVERGAEAYKLANYGYTDKAGFKFGDDPTTGEVVQKLLGFTPPAEANYEEKERTVEGLNQRESFDKSNILTHLARGFNRQDPEEYAKWVKASQEYQRSHPGELPPMAEFSDYLHEHKQAAAISGLTGLPLNTKLRDLTARGAVSYNNRNQ